MPDASDPPVPSPAPTDRRRPSRARRAATFVLVLVLGFAGFALPAILFQMGFAGGYEGANLTVVALLQLVLVGSVVYAGLRLLDMRPRDIGLTSNQGRSDALLGLAVAAAWALVQFTWLIPATGGAARADIASILAMVDGRWANVLWYLPLGIVGGGIAEEVYGRGFVIVVLRDLLGGSTAAAAVAGAFSAVFFAAGHLPQGWVEWVDILVPATAYVLLFVHTRRLVAPMVAHAAWNSTAVVTIYLLYG